MCHTCLVPTCRVLHPSSVYLSHVHLSSAYLSRVTPVQYIRTTWISQIVRDTGLNAADAWELADDRSTWRALRPTAGYAQQ